MNEKMRIKVETLKNERLKPNFQERLNEKMRIKVEKLKNEKLKINFQKLSKNLRGSETVQGKIEVMWRQFENALS